MAESGPWEDYAKPAATAEGGPWLDYQKAAAPAAKPAAPAGGLFSGGPKSAAEGLETARQKITPDYPAATEALTKFPEESQRLSDLLFPVFGRASESIAPYLAGGRAAFAQLSAITPKGLNEALEPMMKGAGKAVEYAVETAIPPFLRDKYKGSDAERAIKEFAPDIGGLALFHGLNRVMSPKAMPLERTMAPAPTVPPPPRPTAAGPRPPATPEEYAAQLEAQNAKTRAAQPPVPTEQPLPEQPGLPSAPPAPPAAVEAIAQAPAAAAPPGPHPMDDLRFQTPGPWQDYAKTEQPTPTVAPEPTIAPAARAEPGPTPEVRGGAQLTQAAEAAAETRPRPEASEATKQAFLEAKQAKVNISDRAKQIQQEVIREGGTPISRARALEEARAEAEMPPPDISMTRRAEPAAAETPPPTQAKVSERVKQATEQATTESDRVKQELARLKAMSPEERAAEGEKMRAAAAERVARERAEREAKAAAAKPAEPAPEPPKAVEEPAPTVEKPPAETAEQRLARLEAENKQLRGEVAELPPEMEGPVGEEAPPPPKAKVIRRRAAADAEVQRAYEATGGQSPEAIQAKIDRLTKPAKAPTAAAAEKAPAEKTLDQMTTAMDLDRRQAIYKMLPDIARLRKGGMQESQILDEIRKVSREGPFENRPLTDAEISAMIKEERKLEAEAPKAPRARAKKVVEAQGPTEGVLQPAKVKTLADMTPEERAALEKRLGAKPTESQAAHAQVEDWAKGEAEKLNAMSDEEKKAYFEEPRKGERGALTIDLDLLKERFHRATRPVREWRNTMAHLLDPGVRATRRETVVGKEAGENAAKLTGRVVSNDVRSPLARQFGKQAELANDALAVVIEAKGDPNHIPTEWAKVLNSPDSLISSKNKANEVYPFAAAHWQELNRFARVYNALTDRQILQENTNGIPTSYRPGYVMHLHDLPETPGGAGYLTGAHGDIPSGFMKIRRHETFGDVMAAGLDTPNMNASDLLESRVARGQRIINDRAWQASLKTITDPKTGLPLRGDPVVTVRRDGTKVVDPPDGYTMQQLGQQQIPILKGYDGLFTALTNPSAFNKGVGGRLLMQGVGTGKSLALMLDTFHLARIGLWSGFLRVTHGNAPITSIDPRQWGKQGLTLMDYSPQEIANMAANGEIPQSWVQNLQRELYKTDQLVKQGFNIGRISDAVHQDWIRSVPGLGGFNKFLFEQFQRGAMREIASMEWDKLERARPNLSDEQIAAYVSKQLNTRFGNLGRQGLLKSRTMQDVARLLMLAPQWNEGLIRSEIGGLKESAQYIARLPYDLATGRRLYSGIMARSFGGMLVAQFAANQLLNLYTRGTPTWENPEEGWGAKMSAWLPDLYGDGPGFFLHPFGLAAETSHLITQGYERSGDFYKTLKSYIRSRSGTAMRPLMTWITDEDMLGRTLKPGTVWGESAKSAIPFPIGSQAYVQMLAGGVGAGETAAGRAVGLTGEESFPGQFQKQAMASLAGMKTEQAPSPEQRISSLAYKFNQAAGKEPQGKFYSSDYQKLTTAIQMGNKAETADALDSLLKTKGPEKIAQHYQTWPTHPFTGGYDSESKFMKTLSQEQKKQYNLARANRETIARKALRLLQQQPKRAVNQ